MKTECKSGPFRLHWKAPRRGQDREASRGDRPHVPGIIPWEDMRLWLRPEPRHGVTRGPVEKSTGLARLGPGRPSGVNPTLQFRYLPTALTPRKGTRQHHASTLWTVPTSLAWAPQNCPWKDLSLSEPQSAVLWGSHSVPFHRGARRPALCGMCMAHNPSSSRWDRLPGSYFCTFICRD